MKPTFSKNIDPIFLHVLELLERIGSNESPDPGEERARIRADWMRPNSMLGRPRSGN